MKHTHLLNIAAAAALLTLASTRAHAATVTSTADSGPGSLRQAIADAAPGDTIQFSLGGAASIYVERLLIINKKLTIQGPGSGLLQVSGQQLTHIFLLGSSADVVMSGLQISHGKSTSGGGIISFGTLTLTDCIFSNNHGGGVKNGGSLTVRRCTFFGNRAGSGGGVSNGGTMAMVDCSLFNNSAVSSGGGISNSGRTVLSRCSLSSNTAQTGGAISNDEGGIGGRGTLSLGDCVVSDNQAAFGGGIRNFGRLTVGGCSLLRNSASKTGGAIVNTPSFTSEVVLTAEDSVFSGNRAGTDGGGIQSSNISSPELPRQPISVTLIRCTLSNNGAVEDGGGVFNEGSAATLTNCSLSGNTAGGAGGGIYNSHGLNDAGVATLTFCRLAGNSATSGGAIFNRGAASVADCTLFANSATDTGGGLENDSGAASLQRCTVAGNGAISGGGIVNRADLTVQSCTINGNIANGGGGLYNLSHLPIDSGDPAPPAAILNIGNSTVSGNRAFLGGGLINYANVLMTSCTLFGNRADAGGGIRNFSGGRIKVGNTLVANSGAGGNHQGDEGSSLTSFGSNLDSDGTCGITEPTDQSGTPDAPLDPKLGPLQNNGGPTATHALAPDSPAVDGGDPALTPGSTDPTDQRGFPRIADGDRNGSIVIDIGAFELSYFGTRGLHVRPEEAFLAFSTVQSQSTDLPAGTEAFNLTIHYGAGIAPETFVAKLNGQDVTGLFSPSTPNGFETVAIPLRAGQNRLIVRAKGTRDGHPVQDVDNLGFRVGEPPFGPR